VLYHSPLNQIIDPGENVIAKRLLILQTSLGHRFGLAVIGMAIMVEQNNILRSVKNFVRNIVTALKGPVMGICGPFAPAPGADGFVNGDTALLPGDLYD
jgi:hypothetical protein